MTLTLHITKHEHTLLTRLLKNEIQECRDVLKIRTSGAPGWDRERLSASSDLSKASNILQQVEEQSP